MTQYTLHLIKLIDKYLTLEKKLINLICILYEL